MTNPTVTPTPAAGNSPSGIYTPVPHVHPVTAITGLRFDAATGRVEPIYDAADVRANGQVIALYNAATAKAGFSPAPVPPVTIQDAVQDNDGASDEGKKQAETFLAEGKITKKEYDTITADIKPTGAGVSAPATVAPGSINGLKIYKEGDVFSYDTVLTDNGTTLGDMIKKVSFPRTIEQLTQGFPGMKNWQIVNNLGALALNIYEPLKKQYPKAFMTNSFRHGSSIGGGSHGTGQGADFQFRGLHSSAYFDVAVWMSKNLPFDQLLLEYMPGKTVWCHISYALPNLPYGGISTLKSKGKASTLATLSAAAGGKFVPGLHADIIANANINRIVAA